MIRDESGGVVVLKVWFASTERRCFEFIFKWAIELTGKDEAIKVLCHQQTRARSFLVFVFNPYAIIVSLRHNTYYATLSHKDTTS